ncbi:MAG: hypothetical protein U1F43_03610 [Myxococcota bacterium]
MRRSMWYLSLIFASSSIAGCYAQAVSQDRFGGELVLGDDSDAAMSEAKDLMTQHCGAGNWRIEGWDTVVVDEEDYSRTDTDSVDDPNGTGGHTTTETHSGTVEKTELHLYYSCLRPTSPTP